MENNTNDLRRSREGEANPMYGRSHSQQTKDAISKSQRERYERMKEKLPHTTMDEFLQSETFHLYLSKIINEQIKKLL